MGEFSARVYVKDLSEGSELKAKFNGGYFNVVEKKKNGCTLVGPMGEKYFFLNKELKRDFVLILKAG